MARKTSFIAMCAWLALGSASAAPAPQQKPQGTQPSPWGICMADVKTPEVMRGQGFLWIKDDALARRLSGDLAAYYVCAAKVAKQDPCKAIDKVAPTYRYKNEIGSMKSECVELGKYADFYVEMMTSKRNARSFPACYRHLRTLGHPMKIFNVDAVAPASANPDPKDKTNDGKFWNVCQWTANGIKDGITDFCTNDARTKYFLAPGLDMNFWKRACGSATRLWIGGDPGFCAILPHEGSVCPSWASFTKAYRAKDQALCPEGSARGLCVAAVNGESKDACEGLWTKLQTDFCDERSKYRPEDMPKKPSAPRKGAGKGG